MKKVTNTSLLKSKIKEKDLDFEVLEDFKGSQVKILFNKKSCEHPPFLATPNNILKGNYNCPICGNISRRNTKRKNSPITIDTVRDTLIKMYPNGEYRLVEGQIYVNNKSNLLVECNICSSNFEISLVNIRQGRGCPNCRKIFLGERDSKKTKLIEKILNEENITFEKEKTFSDCKYRRLLSFDFFLKDYNILIEFDGEQHFKPFNKKMESSIKSFEETKIRDQIKNEYCKTKNIELIRINYKDDIYKELEKLVQRLSKG